MFKRINLQFVISYTGLLPFLIILIDKFFFKSFDINIINDFLIFYSIIICVFIGALNWNLKKNVSMRSVFLGFMPSFVSMFIIIMFLYSYKVISFIVILFIVQLILDNFNYKEKKDRVIFYKLRIPLTLTILFCLIVIQF